MIAITGAVVIMTTILLWWPWIFDKNLLSKFI